MRIIFVTHSYPRWSGDVAGAFVERLVTALIDRGHTVSVVAPAERGGGKREQRDGADVTWVRYAPARWETLAYHGTMAEVARRPSGAVSACTMMLALARGIRRGGAAHVVHAHWWVPAGVGAWLARAHPRYIVTLHGTDVALLERSRFLRSVARRVLKRAAAVTAVSSYLAERAAVTLGIAQDEIVVQPMPADVGGFVRTSAGGGGVVTVGRLTGQKRIHVLLDAFARLTRLRGTDVRLTIIGDGPLRAPLEERAQRLGIANQTHFLGEVEPRRLVGAIGDADVFAFPAVGEGLGLAAAEALVLGIPVVATRDGGGVMDVVPSTGAGRIVAPEDPAAMAHAIDELMGDSATRQLAVEAGKELKARLDPGRVAAAFEQLYETVAVQPSLTNA